MVDSIGFCFLVYDDINQLDLWEHYFSKAGKRAKIFVHRAKSYNKKAFQKCAKESEMCMCPGGNVYYTAATSGFEQLYLSGSQLRTNLKKPVQFVVNCSNEEFGFDPDPGFLKSCYCDPKPGQWKESPEVMNVSALVRDHILPRNEHVYTAWGDISLVRATKVLFRHCYDSGAIKCVLLSGSDVPIRPFNEAYEYLTAHHKSHIEYAEVPAIDDSTRFTQIMMLERFVNNEKRSDDFAFNIDVRHFTYNSMWIVLNREHVKVFIDGES